MELVKIKTKNGDVRLVTYAVAVEMKNNYGAEILNDFTNTEIPIEIRPTKLITNLSDVAIRMEALKKENEELKNTNNKLIKDINNIKNECSNGEKIQNNTKKKPGRPASHKSNS